MQSGELWCGWNAGKQHLGIRFEEICVWTKLS